MSGDVKFAASARRIMKKKFAPWRFIKRLFEESIASGYIAFVGWLGLVTIAIVTIASTSIYLIRGGFSPEEANFIETWWQSLLRALDPGVMSEDEGWALRLAALFVTLGGLLALSSLIGIVSSAIKSKMDQIRRGRTQVVVSGHTLIVRWTPKIFTIVNELITASAHKKGKHIVILGDRDRIEMEEAIRARVPKSKSSKVICRSGKPLEPADISLVNFNDANSIIVLSPEDDNPDIEVIKSTLAITNHPQRKKEKFNIIAELKDENSAPAALIAARNEATFLLSYDLIAKVAAKTILQPGLSVVYFELFDFDGDEIYFQREPALVGAAFRQALFAYEDSSVIGIRDADDKILLNPPMNYEIREKDEIIAISLNDSTIVLSGKTEIFIDEVAITKSVVKFEDSARILILGWNPKGSRIIQELDNYVLKGSELFILADVKDLKKIEDALNLTLSNLAVQTLRGDIAHSPTLEAVNVPSFDHIIIMSYWELPPQDSDAKTLFCLLYLRNIAETHNLNFNIVTEMRDSVNKSLAEIAKPDDFIISDQLVCYMMTQISENKMLKSIFDELFDSSGCDIFLRPAYKYIHPGADADFYTVVESAAQKGEIAIGYRLEKDFYNSDKYFGIVINPNKSERIILNRDDVVITLAREERSVFK